MANSYGNINNKIKNKTIYSSRYIKLINKNFCIKKMMNVSTALLFASANFQRCCHKKLIDKMI